MLLVSLTLSRDPLHLFNWVLENLEHNFALIGWKQLIKRGMIYMVVIKRGETPESTVHYRISTAVYAPHVCIFCTLYEVLNSSTFSSPEPSKPDAA